MVNSPHSNIFNVPPTPSRRPVPTVPPGTASTPTSTPAPTSTPGAAAMPTAAVQSGSRLREMSMPMSTHISMPMSASSADAHEGAALPRPVGTPSHAQKRLPSHRRGKKRLGNKTGWEESREGGALVAGGGSGGGGSAAGGSGSVGGGVEGGVGGAGSGGGGGVDGNVELDADLQHIITEVSGIEQRVEERLDKMQKAMTRSCNFMLDCILMGFVKDIESMREDAPELQAARNATRSITTKLRKLDDVDRA